MPRCAFTTGSSACASPKRRLGRVTAASSCGRTPNITRSRCTRSNCARVWGCAPTRPRLRLRFRSARTGSCARRVHSSAAAERRSSTFRARCTRASTTPSTSSTPTLTRCSSTCRWSRSAGRDNPARPRCGLMFERMRGRRRLPSSPTSTAGKRCSVHSGKTLPLRPPLAGIRVLELGSTVAGPSACRLLADLGAAVYKVEPPGGDQLRTWGALAPDGTGWWFKSHNRGKRLLTFDLRVADDVATVASMALACDVVIENFRPGYLARLGLDAVTLRAKKPELIYLSISGYGQTGPYADRFARI